MYAKRSRQGPREQARRQSPHQTALLRGWVVERQVAIIYVVTNGHLDDVEVPNIRKWEKDFLEYLDSAHPAVLEGIRAKKELTGDVTGALDKAIAAFKPLFRAE